MPANVDNFQITICPYVVVRLPEHHHFGGAGIVAPQNLHFTDILFLSEETICPFLQAGHVRFKLKILRNNVVIKNGFISLPLF
jgi:hypothetical protein